MKKTGSASQRPLFYLFRKKNPEQVPVSIGKRSLYILPTKQGVLFLAILLIMFVGSINYNNNAGFLFTFLLGSMALVSLFHTHKSLVGSAITNVSAKPVFAGETARILVFFKSSARVSPAVMFRFRGQKPVVESFQGTQPQSVELTIKQTTRGRLHLPALTVSTAFPLGLFRAWSTPWPDASYIVYPKPVYCPSPDSLETTGSEKDGQIEIEGVDDFRELKQYTPGDPMHRIAWKAYSKGMGLQTKTFHDVTGQSVIFDYQAIPEPDKELRLSCLCDKLLTAHKRYQSYGIRLPGTVIPPGPAHDPAHLARCLTALALYDEAGDKS